MTNPLPDKAVEAGARALAQCSARVQARGIENTPINWPKLREHARACISAALAAEGLVVVKKEELDGQDC